MKLHDSVFEKKISLVPKTLQKGNWADACGKLVKVFLTFTRIR